MKADIYLQMTVKVVDVHKKYYIVARELTQSDIEYFRVPKGFDLFGSVLDI